MIVTKYDNEYLEINMNNLIRIFIEKQVKYFPNSQRVIDPWVISAAELFCSVIVEYKLAISDMPPVQM